MEYIQKEFKHILVQQRQMIYDLEKQEQDHGQEYGGMAKQDANLSLNEEQTQEAQQEVVVNFEESTQKPIITNEQIRINKFRTIRLMVEDEN